MKPNEEILEFLKENPTFYLATVDGYLPRVRPIGFAMWYNGHLCIALGKHKAAYKQLLDNTNLEICAANDRGEWLRVQGTANFLKPVTEGKDGAHYAARDAVCFETEDFPDAPNHPNFPDTTLLPDQPYSSTTIYRFDLAEM